MSDVPKLPSTPRYDHERDGNPFFWIARMAPKARAERVHALTDIRAERWRKERADMRPLTP